MRPKIYFLIVVKLKMEIVIPVLIFLQELRVFIKLSLYKIKFFIKLKIKFFFYNKNTAYEAYHSDFKFAEKFCYILF